MRSFALHTKGGKLNLFLTPYSKDKYSSPSQRARVATETWGSTNLYCCWCGGQLSQAPRNSHVLDYECRECAQGYELKSTTKTWGHKVVDGAYATMLRRLSSKGSPSFFFLSYDLLEKKVTDLFAVPQYYLDVTSIEKRKPLASTARRAGWVGCTILLDRVPQSGRVHIIQSGVVKPKAQVLASWSAAAFMEKTRNLESRTWRLEVLRCIESLQRREFHLDDVYQFARGFAAIFPNNKHLKPKIRQQLQVLRDAGVVTFVERGRYRLTDLPR